MKGSIRERSKGRFEITVDKGKDLKTGKRVRYFESVKGRKSDAQKRLHELLYTIEKGTYIEPTRLTVAQFLRDWLRDYAAIQTAPKTHERYEEIIRLHLIPALGSILVSSLQPQQIQRYCTYALESGRRDGKGGLAGITVHKHFRILFEALKYGVKHGILARNPAESVDPPPSRSKELTVPTAKDVQLILDKALNTPYFALFYTGVYTAIRRGGLLGLRWCDVDLNEATISVIQTLQQLRNRQYIFKKPKSKHGQRQIDLSPSLVFQLWDHKIRQEQQELLREKDKIEYQLDSIDEQIKKVKEISQQNKEQVNELQNKKSAFKTATLRLNTCLDHESGFIAQLSNARRSLVDLQEKHAKLNARTQSVQAHHTQNMSVSALLKNKKQFPGVYGTVAQLGQVQKKYSEALEAAASGRTNFVVVKDDRTAAECIAYLKQNRLGSASFIPLNKIKTRSITQEDKSFLKQNGVHDFALNLVTFKSEYKLAFSYVFGNSLVVDDLDAAKNVGVGRIRMATLDGSIAESSGVMRGGFKQRSKGSFAEKDSLEELDKFEAYIAEKQSVISSIEVKRQSNEQDISSLRKLKGDLLNN